MDERELKKLSRVELLEILVELSKENEELNKKQLDQEAQFQAQQEALVMQYQQKIDELEKKLEEKKLVVGSAGSLAEACLQLNGVYQATQAAAEQYLVNVRTQEQNCEDMIRQAEETAASRLNEAKKQADEYVQAARGQAGAMLASAQSQSEKILSDTQAKATAYWNAVSQRLNSFIQEHQSLREILNVPGSAGSQFSANSQEQQ